ncbi:transcription antitermination factor NusB [Candidatus Omnitrophota bacterium]
MRKRTKARELALQILYQADVTRSGYDQVLKSFWESGEHDQAGDEVKDFTVSLVKGVADNLKDIDAKIKEYAANWQLERMAFIDRNILRLGAYELLLRDDIPPKVSINEAVELAKKYSAQESSKFVNGILDKVKAKKEE